MSMFHLFYSSFLKRNTTGFCGGTDKVKRKKSGANPWNTILRQRKLMESAHYEGNAQSWFIIPITEFNSYYNSEKDNMPLRIHLFQPSALWSKFEIRDIKVFSLR